MEFMNQQTKLRVATALNNLLPTSSQYSHANGICSFPKTWTSPTSLNISIPPSCLLLNIFLFQCLGGSTSENSLLRPVMLTHSDFMVLMINILYQYTGNWPSVHIFSLLHAGHPCVSPKITCSKILLPKFTQVLLVKTLLHGPWSYFLLMNCEWL